MALELVGGRQGQGQGGDATSTAEGEQRGESASEVANELIDRLAEAERLLAGSRQRLQVLVERAAELRRRLNVVSAPPGDTGSPSS